MKKGLIKLIYILVIITCVVLIGNYSIATDPAEFVKNFSGNSGAAGSDAVKQILSAVLSVVRNVGAVIAVVMLMTIAAKYIVASAGDRADIKKYAMNYVIGAVVLLGATGILSVLKTLIDESLKLS